MRTMIKAWTYKKRSRRFTGAYRKIYGPKINYNDCHYSVTLRVQQIIAILQHSRQVLLLDFDHPMALHTI